MNKVFISFRPWIAALALVFAWGLVPGLSKAQAPLLTDYDQMDRKTLESRILSLDTRVANVSCQKPRTALESLIQIGDRYRALVKERDAIYRAELNRRSQMLAEFLVANDTAGGLTPGRFAKAYWALVKQGQTLGVFRDPATLTGQLPKIFDGNGTDLSKIATHGREWIELHSNPEEAEAAGKWMDKVFLKDGQGAKAQVAAINKAYDQICDQWTAARKEYLDILSGRETDAQKRSRVLAQELVQLVETYERARDAVRQMAQELGEDGDRLYAHCLGSLEVPLSYASALQDQGSLEWVDERARLFYQTGPKGTTEALPGMGYRFLSPTDYRWDRPELMAKDVAQARKDIPVNFPLYLPEFKLATDTYVNHYGAVLEAREKFEDEANRAVGREIILILNKWNGVMEENATGEDLQKLFNAVIGEDAANTIFGGLGIANYTLYTMGNATQDYFRDTMVKPIGESLEGVVYILKGDGDGLTLSERLSALGLLVEDNAKKLPENLAAGGKAVLEKGVQVVANTTKAIAGSAKMALTSCEGLSGVALIKCREGRLEARKEVRESSKQLIEDVTKLSLMVAASKIDTPMDDLARGAATKLSDLRKGLGKQFDLLRQKAAIQEARTLAAKLKASGAADLDAIKRLERQLDDQLSQIDAYEKKLSGNNANTQAWDQSRRTELTNDANWAPPDPKKGHTGGNNQFQRAGEFGYKRSARELTPGVDDDYIKGQKADQYGNDLLGELDSEHVSLAKVHEQFTEVKTRVYEVAYEDLNGMVKKQFTSQKQAMEYYRRMEKSGWAPMDPKMVDKIDRFKSVDEAVKAAEDMQKAGQTPTLRRYQVVEYVPEKYSGKHYEAKYQKIKQYENPEFPPDQKITKAEYDTFKQELDKMFKADELARRELVKKNILHMDDTWDNKSYIPREGGGMTVKYTDGGGALRVTKPLPGCDLNQTTDVLQKAVREATETVKGGNAMVQLMSADKNMRAAVDKYLKAIGKDPLPGGFGVHDFEKYTNMRSIGFLEGDLPPMKVGSGGHYLPNHKYTGLADADTGQLATPNLYKKGLEEAKAGLSNTLQEMNQAAKTATTAAVDPVLKTGKKAKPVVQTTLTASIMMAQKRSRCMEVKHLYEKGDRSPELKKEFMSCQSMFKEM